MPKTGIFRVYCGPMFAGKTTQLLSEYKAAKSAGRATYLFKPVLDVRYNSEIIKTHCGLSETAIWSDMAGSQINEVFDGSFVGIDEAQFFEPCLYDVIRGVLARGCDVVAVGLDLTFEEKPFGIMPSLLALADYVGKLKAKCACGGSATRTFRRATLVKQTVLLGGSELYEPLCPNCLVSREKES